MGTGRRWAQAFGTVSLLLLLAGCSPGALREGVGRFLPRTAPAQNTLVTAPPADPYNRLLIEGEDGNLYIGSPDSPERFALTGDASPRRLYGQATWSPDGSQIAWSELRGDGSRLNTSRFDGTERQSLAVPYLPFYIAWNPNGEQLAYLSNWQVIDGPSIALRLVEDQAEGGQEGLAATTLASGQPLYFSWSPQGDRLLAHLDGERVEIYDLAGESESLIISGGSFSSPNWSPLGEQLVYAVADERTQRLLLTDLAGETLQALTDFTGSVAFSLSPDGSQVAYIATEEGATVSTLGALYVVETGSLRTREISDLPVFAFFWSPDGSKLAFLTLEEVNRRVGMRWHVWDGESVRPYAAFFPSRVLLRDYLPFFDQYAQSHRLWAPDSSAFVFAGTLANGEEGIWMQPVDGDDGTPVNLGARRFCYLVSCWSPLRASISSVSSSNSVVAGLSGTMAGGWLLGSGGRHSLTTSCSGVCSAAGSGSGQRLVTDAITGRSSSDSRGTLAAGVPSTTASAWLCSAGSPSARRGAPRTCS